jgi:hypothetical protein
MSNRKTKTVLPVIRVAIYHDGKPITKYFSLDSVNDEPSLAVPFAHADKYLASIGRDRTHANVYLIDKVNGEWRTDWELEEDGVVLPHPWATKPK